MSEEIRRELERYCWDLNITKEEAKHIQEMFIKQEQKVKEFIRLVNEELLRNGRRALPKIAKLAGDLGNE
jgi:hypothetical protein